MVSFFNTLATSATSVKKSNTEFFIQISFIRCVVWTGDGRVYFYNPSTRTSVWDRPEELFNKAEVDKALNKLPDQLLGVDKPENKAGKVGKDIAESDEGSNDKTGKKRSETESSENELENEEVPSKKLRADVSIGK